MLPVLLRVPASPQVLARIGRGALVGLPAVGALFVAHLAHQDWHRLAEERAAGGTSLALNRQIKKRNTLCGMLGFEGGGGGGV